MEYGFLFGAVAECSYGLPLGGKFALKIFIQKSTGPKQLFKKMVASFNINSYSQEWLPNNYSSRRIASYGIDVYQNLAKSTFE